MSASIAQAMLLLTPLAPALLALLCAWRPAQAWCMQLAPLAFVPAVVSAVASPPGLAFQWLLLDTHIALDSTGRIFLLLSAVMWLLAAAFGRTWLAEDAARGRFLGFFLAAAAGNLGVCVAQDIASFYLSFALMTFSVWGMVIHRHTREARRAGCVYVVLAVIGESALLVAFVLVASNGGSLLQDAAAAAAGSPARDLIIALLLIGFGAKTGVLGLHFVLPLTYASIPAPGAVALAAVMIKAGLLGWLRFLPLGYELQAWSLVFIALGMAAAFYGAAIGLMQREPRVVLAYSSVSQMGLMTVGVGIAFAGPEMRAPALLAITAYAAHHALAKGALFLGEALTRVTARRRWIIAGCVLPAAALAGAPLTSGAVAKHLLKDASSMTPWPDTLSCLLAAAAVGTTLIMLRFLWCVWRTAPIIATRDTVSKLALPWLVALLLVLGAGLSMRWPPSASLGDVWPVALGILIGSLALRFVRDSFSLPPGDILIVGERVLKALRRLSLPRLSLTRPRVAAPFIGIDRVERAFASWNIVGLVLIALLGAFALLLALRG